MLTNSISWKCKHTWKQARINTAWCLLGCSIGDFGTIYFFQVTEYLNPIDHKWIILSLAIMNGLITSIMLETFILSRQMILREAFKVAIGMSLISMISMEAAMNIVDVIMTGGAMLTPQVIFPMLIAGFITPLPYNYWRLKKYNISCH
jgi:hypothetical protein